MVIFAPMRIGFDAKRLFLNHTGLGNYSRTLVSNLIKYHPENDYFLYTPKAPRNSETEFFFNKENVNIQLPAKAAGPLWRSFGIKKQIQKDKVDVFHGLSNELPFGVSKMKLKTFVTIHDLIYERYPKQYGIFDRTVYRFKTKNAIKKANVIISISNQTTEDLQKFYAADTKKIELLYQTCNDDFVSNQKPFKEKTGDYYLYVGSIIERKNLLNVVAALNKLDPEERKKIVVIGNGKAYKTKVENFIAQHDLSDWIEWKSQIANHELRSYYEGAIALVYPSTFEGFGIPVIEALYCGCPVITSNLSSLKEAGGSAAVLVNPMDVGEIVSAMRSVKDKHDLHERNEKLAQHLNLFNPKVLSQKLLNLYKKVLN